jgi:hypothetical protein
MEEEGGSVTGSCEYGDKSSSDSIIISASKKD